MAQKRRARIKTTQLPRGITVTETVGDRESGAEVSIVTQASGTSVSRCLRLSVVGADGKGKSAVVDGRTARTIYRVLAQHYDAPALAPASEQARRDFDLGAKHGAAQVVRLVSKICGCSERQLAAALSACAEAGA